MSLGSSPHHLLRRGIPLPERGSLLTAGNSPACYWSSRAFLWLGGSEGNWTAAANRRHAQTFWSSETCKAYHAAQASPFLPWHLRTCAAWILFMPLLLEAKPNTLTAASLSWRCTAWDSDTVMGTTCSEIWLRLQCCCTVTSLEENAWMVPCQSPRWLCSPAAV